MEPVAKKPTEKKWKFQEELSENELFKIMADSAPVMIWVSGLDKGCFWFNKVWLEFRGKTIQEEYGFEWSNGVHPDDYKRVLDHYISHFDRQQPFTMEYRLQRKDGVYRWVLDNGTPRFDPQGQFIGMIGSCIDITSQKEIEEKLRHAKEQAEAASRVKTQFLAVMSHEIRTPLTAIIGILEVLKHDVAASTHTEEQEKARTQVQPWASESLPAASKQTAPTTHIPASPELIYALSSSAQHLLCLVDDLLDVAKNEARHLVLKPEVFRVDSVVKEICEALRVIASEKQLDLKASNNLPEMRGGWVSADRRRLKQILFNLLGNAIKFTDQGSVMLTVSLVEDRSLHRFQVVDTGCGVPPSFRPNLFTAFSQADSSHTRRKDGAGLGLYITALLVKAFGGTITHEDNVPHGSIFTVDLPLQIVDPPYTVPPIPATSSAPNTPHLSSNQSFSHNPSSFSSFRVLIVEDNAVNQRVIERSLRTCGLMDIELAANGNEAVQKASEKQFGLILMDCQMPEKDGFTATREIRDGDGPNKNAPIVALTALAFPEDMEQCIKAGMNEYISKPFTREQLQALIHRYAPHT